MSNFIKKKTYFAGGCFYCDKKKEIQLFFERVDADSEEWTLFYIYSSIKNIFWFWPLASIEGATIAPLKMDFFFIFMGLGCIIRYQNLIEMLQSMISNNNQPKKTDFRQKKPKNLHNIKKGFFEQHFFGDFLSNESNISWEHLKRKVLIK